MENLIIGFILSTIIALAAFQKQSLSLSGTIMAILVATLLYYFGGYVIWITLMLFFISSSILTNYKSQQKEKVVLPNDKGGRRDYLQVLANGLLPLIFAFIAFMTKNNTYLLIAAVSIASNNADTWASELGILSKGKTVSIISFKPVDKGVSGGVSLLGTIASLCGALFIGLSYVSLTSFARDYTIAIDGFMLLIITAGGLFGCLIDSILGATIQAKYRCVECYKVTEKKIHHEQKSDLIGGFHLITNDVVNFLSPLLSSLIIKLLIV